MDQKTKTYLLEELNKQHRKHKYFGFIFFQPNIYIGISSLVIAVFAALFALLLNLPMDFRYGIAFIALALVLYGSLHIDKSWPRS